jgi:hypothetical protein
MQIGLAGELVTYDVLDTIDKQLAALDAEPGVTVQLHPVSSLGLRRFSNSEPPRGARWLAHQQNNASDTADTRTRPNDGGFGLDEIGAGTAA